MSRDHTIAWIEISAVAGFAGAAAFLILVAAGSTLPPPLIALFAGAWGILTGISGFGLERLIRVDRRRPSADLGAIALYTGGVIVAVMLIVQQTFGEQVGEHAHEGQGLHHEGDRDGVAHRRLQHVGPNHQPVDVGSVHAEQAEGGQRPEPEALPSAVAVLGSETSHRRPGNQSSGKVSPKRSQRPGTLSKKVIADRGS